MTFKPLLAASTDGLDPSTFQFPCYWSPKLDGIRCVVSPAPGHPGACTRTLKRVPNDKIYAAMNDPRLDGMDGELLFGQWTDKDVYNTTQRAVMKIAGPSFEDGNGKYLVFDDFTNPTDPFEVRFARLARRVADLKGDFPFLELVPHQIVSNADDLMNVERVIVDAGYEGVMTRVPKGIYKYGRSTNRDGILQKIKRFADVDCVIVAVYEGQHNGNEAEKDNFGRTKRSTTAEFMIPNGMLGGFTVRSEEYPDVDNFNVAPAVLSHAQRIELWQRRESLVGKRIVAKYQPSGMKDAPRFAGFKAFRKD